jgi:hypothetical protein
MFQAKFATIKHYRVIMALLWGVFYEWQLQKKVKLTRAKWEIQIMVLFVLLASYSQ